MTPEPRGPEVGHESSPEGRQPNRRQALTLVGAAAATASVSFFALNGAFDAGAAQSAQQAPEINFATFVVGLELGAAALYQDFAKSSGLDQSIVDIASACANSHTQQAKALGTMITASGGQVPTDPNPAFTKLFAGKVTPSNPTAAASVFSDLENSFAATYLDGLSTIVSSSLAMLAAQILATDAAQSAAWSAIAQAAGKTPTVPATQALPQTQSTDTKFTATQLPTPTTTSAGDQ